MRVALNLAKKGLGHVSPNPCVGAIVVKNDKIVGEGYHSKAGGHHAEVMAINEAGKLAQDADLYVTLEPCNHFGKTPPCAELIVKTGFRKVFIACKDLNPLVSGKGIAYLESKNIKVEQGILESEAVDLNKGFFKRIKEKKPFITIKIASSIDGNTSLKSGESKWITSEHAREDVQKLRANACAILTGVGTVNIDNPNLNVRSWKGKNPIRIIIDYDNKLSNKFNVFNDQAKTIKITKNNIDQSLPIASEISSLLFKENIQSVIVEGGKKTLEEFIKTNLWDEARIFTNKKNLKKGTEAPKLKGKIILEKKIDDDELKIIKPF